VRASRRLWPALVATSVVLVACSGSDGKADQAEAIASSAGLGNDVAAFVARATTAADGTFTVTYKTTATDGSAQQITVAQRPPDRRVDVYLANGSIESTIRTRGTSYQCTKGETWTCAPFEAQGTNDDGVLDAKTVSAAVQQLTKRAADYDFRVEDRTLVGVTAQCLVTTLKPGHSDPSLGASATLCLAPSGAQLLVDVPRGKLEASDYRADVAADAFSLPAEPASSTASSSGG
jgi:hypothetical protein